VRLALAILALTACATPRGPWTVQGVASSDEEAQAIALVEAAKRVLPDEKGWLAAGGRIWLGPDVAFACAVPAPLKPAGCAEPGAIWVRWPHGAAADLTASALPHELAHLGLASGGGFSGPPDLVSEARADAGALLVVQEYRKSR
jgi:hypothetical protein